MKEQIGKSNKMTFLALAVFLSVDVLLATRVIWRFQDLGWVLLFLLCMSAILTWIAFIRMPTYSIMKEKTRLILYLAPFRKYVIEITDIISVDINPPSGKETAAISFVVCTTKGNKKISVLVTNRTEAQKKLQKLISK